jgi:hypothetical protein
VSQCGGDESVRAGLDSPVRNSLAIGLNPIDLSGLTTAVNDLEYGTRRCRRTRSCLNGRFKCPWRLRTFGEGVNRVQCNEQEQREREDSRAELWGSSAVGEIRRAHGSFGQ